MHGWGRYPQIENPKVYRPREAAELKKLFSPQSDFIGIPRGMGRSYGDSALASHIIDMRAFNYLISFDCEKGLIRCAAGMTFADLLAFLIPRGFFVPVTPGTQWITVGGAIASDIHGKNHHKEGSFCDHLLEFRLMTGSGEIVSCSRDQHPDLFFATCGGMGLTGVILDATFRLKHIKSSDIEVLILKAPQLKDLLALLTQHECATYAVAWVDLLAKRGTFGRGILMLGEHATSQGTLDVQSPRPFAVPLDLPSWFINYPLMKAFNILHYHTHRAKQEVRMDYASFFYPLDKVQNWNRLYGSTGFIQYQCVVPKESGAQGIETLLTRIAHSNYIATLGVLKTFGKGNAGYLSFPQEGYTLAVDFKIASGLFDFLNTLDRIVLDCGGRLYLTKDARMSAETFKKSYPQWEAFQAVRTKFGADRVFCSLQSKRLGLG